MLKAGPLGGHAGLDALVGGTAEAAKCAQGQTLHHGGDLKLRNGSSLPRYFQPTIGHHCPAWLVGEQLVDSAPHSLG